MPGYGDESLQMGVMPDALTTIITSGVTDNLRLFRVLRPITVKRIGFLITTAITVTAPVMDFDRRITPGSDTGRVDQGVGRMTFPAVAGLAIGVTVYKNVNVNLNPGDEVSVQVVTASTAGAGIPFMEYFNAQEVPANFTEFLAAT